MSIGMMTTKEILDTIKLSKEPNVTKEIKKLAAVVNKARMEMQPINAEDIKKIKALKKKQKEIEKARIRVQEIDQEDLDLIEENYMARELFTMQGVKNLYSAICNQAVHDYKQTSKYIAKKAGTSKKQEEARQIRDDAKRFFSDPLFKNVTGMQDPKETEELVIKQMKIEASKKLSMMKA